MATITRRPAARDDLIAIWRYIARDSERYADELIDRIDAKLRMLADNPMLGRSREELAADLRSFTVGNYVLFYIPDEGGLTLIRVLHGARDVRDTLIDD